MVRVASGDRMLASQVLRQPEVRLADLIRDGLVILEIDAGRRRGRHCQR